MKKLQIIKGLAAVALVAVSGAASADAVQLVQSGNHSLSTGGIKNFFFGGEGTTGPAPSTATWDWNAGTGVLTQTGGVLYTQSYTGNNPVTGTSIWGDKVTGLVIDTVAGTVTASSYECLEGGFGVAATGVITCGGYAINSLGNESTRNYNVGSADCMNVAIGGDDGPKGIMRGLRDQGAAGSCDQTDGAMDMIHVKQDNLSIGGTLILANVGSRFGTDYATVLGLGCVAGASGNTACADTHWLTFVPVPGAAWLFTSALGLVGLARRRLVK